MSVTSKKSINQNLHLFSKKYSRQDSINFDETNILESVIHLLTKENRKDNDNGIIFNYLLQLNFVNSIKETEDNYQELIAGMSHLIKHKQFQSNTIIFKYGDIRENFYIIFRGSASIIVPSEIQIMMNQKEYIFYLLKLKYHEENEILSKCLFNNKNIFFLNEELLNQIQFNNIKRKSSFHTGIYDSIQEFLNSPSKSREGVSPMEYTERIKPEIEGDNNWLERRMLTIYEYKKVLTLKEGDKFGDYAFSSILKKRTATIITETKCDMGLISKTDYDLILYDINVKIKNSNVLWLFNVSVFKEIDKMVFEKKYYNYFVKGKGKPNQYLAKDGDEMEYIYFTKSGNFEISKKFSVLELDKFIRYIKGEKDEYEEQHVNRKYTKTSFEVFLNQSQINKIAICSDKDIFGLFDTQIEGKSIFTIKSLDECEYFKIERNLFLKIFEKENSCKLLTIKFCDTKRKIYLERLINIRKSLLLQFKKSQNKAISSESQKSSFDTTTKRLSRVKKQLIKQNQELTLSLTLRKIKPETKKEKNSIMTKLIKFERKDNKISTRISNYTVSMDDNNSRNEGSVEKKRENNFYFRKIRKSCEKDGLIDFGRPYHSNNRNKVKFVDFLAFDSMRKIKNSVNFSPKTTFMKSFEKKFHVKDSKSMMNKTDESFFVNKDKEKFIYLPNSTFQKFKFISARIKSMTKRSFKNSVG